MITLRSKIIFNEIFSTLSLHDFSLKNTEQLVRKVSLGVITKLLLKQKLRKQNEQLVKKTEF